MQFQMTKNLHFHFQEHHLLIQITIVDYCLVRKIIILSVDRNKDNLIASSRGEIAIIRGQILN